jgi:hypothetical protein
MGQWVTEVARRTRGVAKSVLFLEISLEAGYAKREGLTTLAAKRTMNGHRYLVVKVAGERRAAGSAVAKLSVVN